MNAIPLWVQYLQALSTPALAIMAVLIGVMQWRTAHQRAVLDLFDRRMKVYGDLVAVTAEIVREGRAELQSLLSYSRSEAEARFLFGSEVSNYLEEMR